MTGRDACAFTVKEYGDGTLFIMVETRDGNLAMLQFGDLYFDLRDGTTLAQAQEISKELNDKIDSIAYTIPVSDVDIPLMATNNQAQFR
jgi:hypothetical protein